MRHPGSSVSDEIDAIAAEQQTPLTLTQLYEFGVVKNHETRLQAARFLHRELPIRLARMTREIESLPFGLTETRACRQIHALYIQSFMDILHSPVPETEEDEEEFTRLLDAIKNRHGNVVKAMAFGVIELKQRIPDGVIGPEITGFLDRFYMSRIGIRMLIGQQIALRNPDQDWVGIIHSRTSPADVAAAAATDAESLCRQNYGEAPRVEIRGRTDLRFTTIPTHLHHMLLELLKNSFRATLETHGHTRDLPPVRIIIADGTEDVAIKIEDEGGGIPRSGMQKVWTYLYTTAPPPEERSSYLGMEVDPMAGHGYGLPITRLYARYFGGDLTLISMEGYGTDAYLYLNRLATHKEALP